MAEVGSWRKSRRYCTAADDFTGLQCHTAPFSWKIVFECDYQLYEIMLTACTPKEEDEWRSRLGITPMTVQQEQATRDLYSSIFLDIKSLGTVFGKQGKHIRTVLPVLINFSDCGSRWHRPQDLNPQSDNSQP